MRHREVSLFFPVVETRFRRNDPNRHECLRIREPVVWTIELDQNDDIIIWCGCSGFTWRPRVRSQRRLVEQHQALGRILEDFALTFDDVLLFDNVTFHHSRCVRALVASM